VFDVDVDGLRDLERDWRDALEVVSDGVRKGVRLAVEEGPDEARRLHQYKDRSGKLTRSIKGRVLVSAPGGAVGEIIARPRYASFVENGTRPHDIWPKTGYGTMGPLRPGQSRRRLKDVGTHRVALRWVGPDGRFRFARMVRHPGSKPHPFMSFAFLKAERVVLREIERAVALARRLLER
jgi:hypothetical protein